VSGAVLMKLQTKRFPMLYVLLIVTFLVVLFFSMKGATMTIFSGKEEEVVLFSPMEGKLTFEGKPAADAKIVRSLKWKGEVVETDTFHANQKGEFDIPSKKDTIKISPLTQFVVQQDIFVYFKEKKYHVWDMGKLSKLEYGELYGRPINLHCELTEEMIGVDVLFGLLETSCKWDSIIKNKGDL
jgi:hypothetical protein